MAPPWWKSAAYLLLAALAGCASAGTAFDWKKAKQVSVGMSEVELIALMGKPNSVTTKGDLQVWIWVHASSSVLTGAATRHVSFAMKDRKVASVPNMMPFE